MIWDNLSSHKAASAIQAIEAVGAKAIPLPAYSPDLNPIENVFSKLKQLIRRMRPRSWSEIVQAAKEALLQITHDDISNAFIHCGYS